MSTTEAGLITRNNIAADQNDRRADPPEVIILLFYV
jgi:hypothetical protein